MKARLSKFVEMLESLNPSDGDDIVDVLYELIEEIENEEGVERIIPNILDFIERNPSVNMGLPGPLVHLIEKYYPYYIDALKASVKRKPTTHTVWMLNRILNSKLNEIDRKSYLQLLLHAQSNNKADQNVREEAKHYYEYQLKKYN